MSYVAVNAENEQIIAHAAIMPGAHTNHLELGMGFTDPSYRGHGCLGRLLESQVDSCRASGAGGVFAMAVTSHPYTQKALSRMDWAESALLLSYYRPASMTLIQDDGIRESCLLMDQSFHGTAPGAVHVPEAHRDIVLKIYRGLGIEPEVTCNEDLPGAPSASSRITLHTSRHLYSHIHVHAYGSDVVREVGHILKSLCLSRVETVCLHLPTHRPETAVLCRPFEEMGFFFAGIAPGGDGHDWLALQYLNNQAYPDEALHLASNFSRELAAYVRARDPNRGLRQ
jgi:serine/threonine-protein kinase RsbW